LELSLVEGAAIQSITEESQKEITSRKENYALSVPKDGSTAVLTANSTLGLLRGLTTFDQLWYYFEGEIYTLEAPVEITDAPAYVRPISSTRQIEAL
jgi:hexosaminidase